MNSLEKLIKDNSFSENDPLVIFCKYLQDEISTSVTETLGKIQETINSNDKSRYLLLDEHKDLFEASLKKVEIRIEKRLEHNNSIIRDELIKSRKEIKKEIELEFEKFEDRLEQRNKESRTYTNALLFMIVIILIIQSLF